MLTRRDLGAAALASVALGGRSPFAFAQGAKHSLKLGGQFQASHPASVAMDEACAEIRKESNGEIDIHFFPNAQLGSDAAMLQQIRQGVLDMMTASGIAMQVMAPVAGISGIAFAFPDYTKVWQALDGDLGAEIRAGLEKVGIFGFPKCLDSGYRDVTTSTKPINTADDFKGLKIRVPPSPLWVSLFTALGASPTSITINELYAALQTKVVDGQENPLTIIEAQKLYEVQKFCSMTDHLWDGLWIIASGRKWKSLPSDAQAVISRNFEAATIKQRDTTARLNTELEETLKAKGLVFNRPDKMQFREVLSKAGFYAEWKKRYGPEAWTKLEKYSGPLS
jgi:tripartite ATP-independent transporter DctP family solute receptor